MILVSLNNLHLTFFNIYSKYQLLPLLQLMEGVAHITSDLHLTPFHWYHAYSYHKSHKPLSRVNCMLLEYFRLDLHKTPDEEARDPSVTSKKLFD